MPFAFPPQPVDQADIEARVELLKDSPQFETKIADSIAPRVKSQMSPNEWDRFREYLIKLLIKEFNPVFRKKIANAKCGPYFWQTVFGIRRERTIYSEKGHDTIKCAMRLIIKSTYPDIRKRDLRSTFQSCHNALYLFLEEAFLD